jgi:hypothetical protein
MAFDISGEDFEIGSHTISSWVCKAGELLESGPAGLKPVDVHFDVDLAPDADPQQPRCQRGKVDFSSGQWKCRTHSADL